MCITNLAWLTTLLRSQKKPITAYKLLKEGADDGVLYTPVTHTRVEGTRGVVSIAQRKPYGDRLQTSKGLYLYIEEDEARSRLPTVWKWNPTNGGQYGHPCPLTQIYTCSIKPSDVIAANSKVIVCCKYTITDEHIEWV